MNPDIERGLGRVEGKLDRIIASMDAFRADHKQLEERVDAVEKDQHTSKTVLTLLAAGVGFIASNITSVIGWFKA